VCCCLFGYHIIIHDHRFNVVVGYHGLIYVDADQHMVHRTLQADNILNRVPLRSDLTLDYGFEKIGDADYFFRCGLKFNHAKDGWWPRTTWIIICTAVRHPCTISSTRRSDRGRQDQGEAGNTSERSR